MRRFQAASALILTAFFAVAGAYHHHHLPRASHDHAGLCSDTSAAPALDTCAICQATHTAADRLAVVEVAAGLSPASPLALAETFAPPPLDSAFPHGSRAPPTV